MRFLSPLIGDARGSLGTMTFSRNTGGQYIRARTAPTQPRTTRQVLNRTNFGTATAQWRALTPATRAAFDAFAVTAVRTDSLGQRYRPSGFTTYMTNLRHFQSAGLGSTIQTPNPNVQPGTGTFLGLGNVSSGGVLTQVTAVITPTAVYWYRNMILQATKPSPDTALFQGRSHYRNIPTPGTYSTTNIDVLAAYIAVFGSAATIGQWIYSRARWVDPETGQVGPWQYAPYGRVNAV